MSRNDIILNIETNDFANKIVQPDVVGTASWRVWTAPSGNKQVNLAISLPTENANKSVEQGFYFVAPYKPLNLVFTVTIINEKDGKSYFPFYSHAKASLWGGAKSAITACQLPLISSERLFLKMEGDTPMIYSGENMDFKIASANFQNKALMLMCMPGNCYRYPLTGVGLERWVNSTSNLNGLAERLQSEFTADGTPVLTASYNASKNGLAIELDTTLVDTYGNI